MWRRRSPRRSWRTNASPALGTPAPERLAIGSRTDCRLRAAWFARRRRCVRGTVGGAQLNWSDVCVVRCAGDTLARAAVRAGTIRSNCHSCGDHYEQGEHRGEAGIHSCLECVSVGSPSEQGDRMARSIKRRRSDLPRLPLPSGFGMSCVNRRKRVRNQAGRSNGAECPGTGRGRCLPRRFPGLIRTVGYGAQR